MEKMSEQKGKGERTAAGRYIFLLFFIGMGIVSGDFSRTPAIVGFLIALMAAFFQNRKVPFNEKMRIAAAGVGDDNIMTMCLIFLAAGGFSGAVSAAGGVESTVNFSLSVLPSSVAVVGLMLISCFISTVHGDKYGNDCRTGADRSGYQR